MPEFAVTAIGRDQPGIVAAITGALLELDGNVADSQMSILGGHFAVMLLVTVPAETSQAGLEESLANVRADLSLDAVAVAAVGKGAPAVVPTHVLSVYGADHPGIVHAVSSALAGLGVNITDLETKLTGSAQSPVYVMVLEVALAGVLAADVEAALRQVGGDSKVEVSLRELDTETL